VDDVFSGKVVRSPLSTKSETVEYFQWFDSKSYPLEIVGDSMIDLFEFRGVPKLGPGLLYDRPLPTMTPDKAEQYFRGNLAVRDDTIYRQETYDPDTQWLTEAERVAGFHEIFPPGFLEKATGTVDAICDAEAAKGTKWMTVRAICEDSGEYHETLCWMSGQPSDPDSAYVDKAVAHLRTEDLLAANGLIEIYDTHALRPQSGMIFFEIMHKL
jgi:hypothetical protein